MSLNRPNPNELANVKSKIQSEFDKERKRLDAIDAQLHTSSLANALVLFPASVLPPGKERANEAAEEAAKPVEKNLEERLKNAQEYFHGVDYRLEESKRELKQLLKQREELNDKIKELDQKIPKLVKERDKTEIEVHNLFLEVNEKNKNQRCTIS